MRLPAWLRRREEPPPTAEETEYLLWLRPRLDEFAEVASLRDAWRRAAGAESGELRAQLEQRLEPALLACREERPPARFSELHAMLAGVLETLTAACAAGSDAEVARLDRQALLEARRLARLAARLERWMRRAVVR